MRRPDIIQLIIITIALLLAYNAFEAFPQFIILLVSCLFNGLPGGNALDSLVYVTVYLGIYTVAVIILVNRSKGLALYISEKFDLTHTIRLDQSKNNLLYALFIGLGLYTLMQKLPVLFNSIWKSFKQVSRRGMLDLLENPSDNRPDFLLLTIQIVLPLLLIIFARDLANYFSDKIKHEDEIEDLASQNQD